MESAHAQSASDSPTMAISRGVTSIYKDHLGRGPDHVHTIIADNEVITVLRSSLTKAEKKLVQEDRGHAVRSIRREFQDTMREDMTSLVEETLGRKAICLLSDHLPDPDYAVELVILEPRS